MPEYCLNLSLRPRSGSLAPYQKTCVRSFYICLRVDALSLVVNLGYILSFCIHFSDDAWLFGSTFRSCSIVMEYDLGKVCCFDDIYGFQKRFCCICFEINA